MSLASPLKRPRSLGGFFDTDEIVLEIMAGEGGDDSKIFVGELFDAYLKYSRSLNFKDELLDRSFGHIVAKITGSNVGAAFQHEVGKHVVQRIPPTEHNGRKQTSVVVVGILPIKENTDFEPLNDSELEITTTKGQGPGGQHRNKAETAVRIKHCPTGITVFICTERSQHSNKMNALNILTAKVNELRLAAINGNYAEIRKSQLGDGGRSNKRRTYNFLESRVVDHVLNKKTGNIKAIMNGKFDLLFK